MRWAPLIVIALLAGPSALAAGSSTLSETFSGDVWPPPGWVNTNLSEPRGDKTWSDGPQSTMLRSRQGEPDNFAAVSYESAADANSGAVSNWLITPALTLHNGDEIAFSTSAYVSEDFPDRLQVRFNPRNSGTNVGADAGSVGDFVDLLLDINPQYATTDEGGTYPTQWTNCGLTVSGLPRDTLGRLAFRYLLEDTSTQGNEIGIDDVTVTSVPEPQSLFLLAGAAAAFALCRRCRRSAAWG